MKQVLATYGENQANLSEAERERNEAVLAAIREALLKGLEATLKFSQDVEELKDLTTEALLEEWDKLTPTQKNLAIAGGCTVLGVGVGLASIPTGGGAAAAAAAAAGAVGGGVLGGACGFVLTEEERKRNSGNDGAGDSGDGGETAAGTPEPTTTAPSTTVPSTTVPPTTVPPTTAPPTTAPPTTAPPSDTVTEEDWRTARAEWKRGLRPRSDVDLLFNRWLCQQGWQSACDIADDIANGR